MRILSAEVIVTGPGRNFVTLKLVTDEGVTGVGDATLNGRELAVAAYLTEHVVPVLIGRDPARIEDTWQYLYKGAYWRRGQVTMTAIEAVDVALWDVKGKIAGLPVYQLLGGRARDRVLVYGHSSAETVPGVLDEVQIHLIPVLLGHGRRLFDVLPSRIELDIVRVIDTPEATHIRYRVCR